MSKGTMIAFLAGAVAVIVGIVLLVVWWGDFLVSAQRRFGTNVGAWWFARYRHRLERISGSERDGTANCPNPTTISTNSNSNRKRTDSATVKLQR
ncbi:MAG: hypothetical protein DFNUSKGM_002962 [Candidatus Fervidibacter sacchari]